MPGIAVEIVIDAPASFVWADVEDIATHVDWMQDAAEIRFLSDTMEGVGTRFECDTVVGPFKLTDVMEITEWEHGRTMGVHHQGIVGGTGVFRLTASGSATIFSWVEELDFPWYFAGAIGAFFARPILRLIWRGNLRRLKRRVETAWAHERASGS
ncbi:MAG: SRPBCC family protein [Actinomycetota bacterium]